MESIDSTERDLAGDAQWKLIQKNCFTRWANEHLKTVNKNIADLSQDLSDGLRLIALVEVLSGKRFRKFNKRPTFRNQKLENVTIALKFLEVDEGIKIVNIDSSDIVDHKLKLILGLIWTLILHYSISMPVWDDDRTERSRSSRRRSSAFSAGCRTSSRTSRSPTSRRTGTTDELLVPSSTALRQDCVRTGTAGSRRTHCPTVRRQWMPRSSGSKFHS